MHILYVDESGTHTDARYLVVAGISVFERETYFLARDLDQLQAKYFPDVTTPIAFHASALRAPAGRLSPPFNTLTDEQRRGLIAEIYQVIANSRARLATGKIWSCLRVEYGLKGIAGEICIIRQIFPTSHRLRAQGYYNWQTLWQTRSMVGMKVAIHVTSTLSCQSSTRQRGAFMAWYISPGNGMHAIAPAVSHDEPFPTLTMSLRSS